MAADKRKPKKTGQSGKRSTDGKRVKDPGPPYVVMWHPGADAERDSSWPTAEKVAMLHAAQKLEAAGPEARTSTFERCPRRVREGLSGAAAAGRS